MDDNNKQAPIIDTVTAPALTAADIQTLASVAVDRMLTARQMGLQYGGDRDLWKQLGYRDSLSFSDYEARYEREGLSGRIIDKPVSDSWRKPPIITDGGRTDTEFLIQLDVLIKRFRLWSVLGNVDRVSGVGHYGILVIGLRGKEDLGQPAERVGGGGLDNLLYLRPYDEGEAAIKTWDRDEQSPRFGMPETYEISAGIIGDASMRPFMVNWSRVIHVAENSINGIVGRPRLKRSYNRLDDLDKVLGPSAEAFWRMVLKLMIATEQAGKSIKENRAELEEQIQDLIHGMTRVGVFSGVDLSELGQSESPQPKEVFDMLIAVISADTEMPRNLLLGSEQGIRASDVDATNWGGTIANRQEQHCEPVILRPTLDRFIAVGVLPVPDSGSYDVKWQAPYTPSPAETATTNKTNAETLAIYLDSGAVDIGAVALTEARVEAQFPPELPEGENEVDSLLDDEDAAIADEIEDRVDAG